MDDDRFDRYWRGHPESKIELIDGHLVIGNSMSGSRYVLHGMLASWGPVAALPLAPERLCQSTPEGDNPWMLIAQVEQEHDCDLIVIGRQGRHALEDLMLGSTTRMVLAECSADVLLSTHRPPKP